MSTSEERHAWLEKARIYCSDLLHAAGCPIPDNVRVTVGFPSTGGRGKRIGECVYDEGVSDQFHEIFVSPVLDNGVVILATLTHELIHAARPKAKHGKAFKEAAIAVGLKGKMTATEAGDELKDKFSRWIAETGDYPAGAISLAGRTKQKTYLLKAECETCGYTVRITAQWVKNVGAPHCPDHGAMSVDGVSEHDPLPDDEDEPEDRPEPEPEPELTVEDEPEIEIEDGPEMYWTDGYRVDQNDPEHERAETYPSDQRKAAEARARQWSKTGTEKQAVCRAFRDGKECGYRPFFAGLASQAVGDYPLE